MKAPRVPEPSSREMTVISWSVSKSPAGESEEPQAARLRARAAAVTAAIADLRFMCVYSPFSPNLCGIVCAFRSASPEARPLYRISGRVSTMVRYNRGKAFAKMSPVLCGNGKVCKEYAKTAGVRDGKRGGGVRAPRPTHGFLSGAVGRPALWPPWPFAAAEKCPGGMNPSPTD